MPKGPKGEKRPADVIGNAVKVMQIAVGEDDDAVNVSAVVKGRAVKGGTARSDGLTKSRRSEIARIAAEARWQKK